MSDVSDTMTAHRPNLSALDRTATLVSWALAGALFLTIGWFAMEPDDPLGAVSLLTRRGTLMMVIQAAALAGVVGGLATVIVGWRLTDAGPFAVSLGLAAVSLRGATAEYLLVQGAEVSPTFERGLAWRFAVEAVGWFLVVIVAVVVSSAVRHWCFGRSDGSRPPGGDGPSGAAPTIAGYDIPYLSSRWFAVGAGRRTAATDGVVHTLTVTGVGLAAMALLSVGLSTRVIQHGQACFVVAAGVCAAVYVACRSVPVRSALWSLLAVGLMALVGYVWAGLRPAAPGLPPNIPSSHFLRILPVQFISVGTAAALGTFWYVFQPASDGRSSRKAAARTSSGKGRR